MTKFKIAALAAALAVLGLVVAAGQGSAAQTVLTANMNGANEVPGPGDPNGTGLATIRLDDVANTVCFSTRWNNITAPMAGHIHSGAAGVAGPVVVTLFTQTNPLPDTLISVAGCVKNVDHQTILDIKANPSSFYVNLHTADFSSGAIRGQLH